MQKKITAEEYKQAFSKIKGLSVVELFKAMGPVLFFVLKDKSGKELNLTIDGMWDYVDGDYTFSSNFINNKETVEELYKSIENFVSSKLMNKIQVVTDLEFTPDVSKVKIVFDNSGYLNVSTNKFGLMTLSDSEKKTAFFSKSINGVNRLLFFDEMK